MHKYLAILLITISCNFNKSSSAEDNKMKLDSSTVTSPSSNFVGEFVEYTSHFKPLNLPLEFKSIETYLKFSNKEDSIPKKYYNTYLKDAEDNKYSYNFHYYFIGQVKLSNEYICLIHQKSDGIFKQEFILSVYSKKGQLIDKVVCWSIGDYMYHIESKITTDTIYLNRAYDLHSANVEAFYTNPSYTKILEKTSKLYINDTGNFVETNLIKNEYTGMKYAWFYKYPVPIPEK